MPFATLALITATALAAASDADPAVSWPPVSTELPPAGGGERDAAVVVGISRYAFLPEIVGAADNAADWYQHLTRVRGVPAAKASLLRDSEATRERIEKALAAAAGAVGSGGTVWLVFIGHGAPSAAGDDGVLLGVDTQADLDSLGARGVSQAAALAALQRGNAASVVAVFDACFSGRSPDGGRPLVAGMQATVPVRRARSSTSGVNAAVLSSSPTFAGPLPGAGRPAFSYVLLGALRGWAHPSGGARVTARDAIEYTRSTLTAALKSGERAPALEGAGDVVLALKGPERGPDVDALVLGRCPAGTRWRERTCERVPCPAGLTFDGNACAPAVATAIVCPPGSAWNGTACAATAVQCPPGTSWSGAACVGAPVEPVTGARDQRGTPFSTRDRVRDAEEAWARADYASAYAVASAAIAEGNTDLRLARIACEAGEQLGKASAARAACATWRASKGATAATTTGADIDGDGVFDAADRCGGERETRNGFQDDDGCADEVPQALRFGVVAIQFLVGKARVTRSEAVLDQIAKTMRDYPAVRVEVSVHTDSHGDDAYNLQLSQARADAVVQELVARGIPSARLAAHGYGETMPVASNATADGRAQNRRVEVRVVP